MTGIPITSELVVFLVTVFGAIAAVWWRVEGRIDRSRLTAERVAADLATYRTHVAETYITKQGLREQTEQLMGGINDLKATVDHLNARIDSILNQPNRTPRPRSPRQG